MPIGRAPNLTLRRDQRRSCEVFCLKFPFERRYISIYQHSYSDAVCLDLESPPSFLGVTAATDLISYVYTARVDISDCLLGLYTHLSASLG